MNTTPFQVKDFALLEQSMLNYVYRSDNALTDFNVGSVMRTMLGALAMEQEELYFRLWQGIQDAIKNSILQAFDFTPSAGSTATGTVKFVRETAALADITILEGVELTSSTGIKYKTTQQVVLLLGATEITASVVSVLASSKSNLTVIGARLQQIAPVYGISWVETSTILSGGEDIESYQAVLTRFREFIQTLSRSTLKAIEYGALTVKLYDANGNITEQVKQAQAVDYIANKGLIDVYIDNGSGSASLDLIAETQKIIDGYVENDVITEGYKAAGTTVIVQSVSKIDVDVVITLESENFDVVKGYAEAAVTSYFTGIKISKVVNIEKLIADVFYAHSDITDVVLATPANDVVTGNGQRAILNSITITETV